VSRKLDRVHHGKLSGLYAWALGQNAEVAHQVLYFPYISVPEDAWFTSVLLHWDKVGSIVPAPYVREPQRLSAYMQDLLAAELVLRWFPSTTMALCTDLWNAFCSFSTRNVPRKG
jgi:hypothetical protein